MFSFFLWGWTETLHLQKKRTSREKIDLILEILEHGLATESFSLPTESEGVLHFEEFESLRENLHQNKLIQAVNQVIQEKGFQ